MAAEWIINTYTYFYELFRTLYLKIIVAVIILFIGVIIGKIIGKIIKKLLHEIELNNIMKKATGITIELETIISAFVTYFIYFIAIIMSLNQLNITTTVLSMLSAAVIILVLIAIVLAVKDFIPNIFAGFYIYKNKFIKKGECISVKGMEGEVKEITLFETKIETKDGDQIFIPNSALTKTEIVKLNKKS